MSKKELIDSLYIDKKLADDINFNAYYQIVQSGLAREITVNGRKMVSLGTNDYLGIANNAVIKKEATKILETFGLSLCGTPIVVGQSAVNRELELATARFLKQEDALVFPSCYQANMSLFQLMAGENDVIIADKEIHSSLLNGVALSKAAFKIFPHNDMNKLEKTLLRCCHYRVKFIVLEGLYSTNGDTPPLKELTDVARRHDAFVIVDDAHGLGVLGREGRGILELTDTYQDVDLMTGSFGKAVGTFGGFIAGKADIIDGFRYKAPMYFYSTALPPVMAGATIASLRYVEDHPRLREKIMRLARKLYEALDQMRFNLTGSTTPLVSVVFKTSENTFLAAKMLSERGIYGVPFIPPSVAKNTARIRLTVNALLEDEDIDKTISAFEEIKQEKPEWLR